MILRCSGISIVNFEQVNTGWDYFGLWFHEYLLIFHHKPNLKNFEKIPLVILGFLKLKLSSFSYF